MEVDRETVEWFKIQRNQLNSKYFSFSSNYLEVAARDSLRLPVFKMETENNRTPAQSMGRLTFKGPIF